jgi:hypothetical protein
LARAKSTARSEARRRYRASQAAADDAEATSADAGGAAGTGVADATPQRRGLLGFTMPDWRGDIRAFPHELRTNRWWWISTLLLLSAPVAYVAGINVGPEQGSIIELYVRLMVSPPAIPILVAGFMSRRGPYLIGFVLGALDGVLYAYFQTAGVETGALASDFLAIGAPSAISNAFLGAAFGWLAFIYKGWLQNSSRRRLEQREKQAQEQKRKARDEARQNRSGR